MTGVGLSGFPKEQQNTPVMVYDDLMIRNNTVSYYNTNRSRPVTVRCIYSRVGAPVDRRRLTGLTCPNRTLISVRIIVPFLRKMPLYLLWEVGFRQHKGIIFGNVYDDHI